MVRDEVREKYPDALHELTSSLVKSGRFVAGKTDVAAKIGAAFFGREYDILYKVLTEPKDRISRPS